MAKDKYKLYDEIVKKYPIPIIFEADGTDPYYDRYGALADAQKEIEKIIDDFNSTIKKPLTDGKIKTLSAFGYQIGEIMRDVKVEEEEQKASFQGLINYNINKLEKQLQLWNDVKQAKNKL